MALKQDRKQLKTGRGVAGEGKRGALPLYIGQPGALPLSGLIQWLANW